MDPAPRELLALASTIAREAGALLLARRGDPGPWGRIDRAVEDLVVRRTREIRPGDAILAEEGTALKGTSGVRWVIDPVDGTVNYLRGIPHFSVTLGVEVNGVTVAGAVFSPAEDELFAATRGGGATLNGQPIRVSSLADLRTAVVGTGFGSDDVETAQRQATVFAHVLASVADIRRTGSAALDLCWVACGRLDAYYEFGQYAWDVCAGDLIVHEAGGFSAALASGPPEATTWVAANASLADAFRDLVSEADRA